MPRTEADKIRNVALVGHRGSGKTSLNEALLYEAGAVNRLGSVAEGTTVSDSAPDEKGRQMSIASSLASFEWEGRKVNLIDTTGEPSFVADALAALRVCESAIFVINGVMGVEVNTERLWTRAAELGLSRLIFVNMLDRERADFYRALDQIKESFGPHAVATEIPIAHEELVSALKDGVTSGKLFPITCGVATRNLATNRLLDAIIEDLPSPVRAGAIDAGEVQLEPDPDADL